MQYRVKAYSVTGKGNKPHRSGTILNENQFSEGTIGKLLADGAIVEHTPDAPVSDANPAANTNETGDAGNSSAEGGDDNTGEGQPGGETSEEGKNETGDAGNTTTPSDYVVPAMEDISLKDIKNKLKELAIPFDTTKDKETLYNLLVSATQKG